jgi:thioredoxin-related protein
MKNILLILLFTCSLFAAEIDTYAKEMNFYRDYDLALAEAKKANKPIMLVIVADYCPWCRKLERRTLASDEIKARRNEVVSVIMDQKYDADRFPKMFLTPRKPTVFFIDPHTGEHFYESIGYVKKDEFADSLDEVKKEFKR